jgi:hypothetical protein
MFARICKPNCCFGHDVRDKQRGQKEGNPNGKRNRSGAPSSFFFKIQIKTFLIILKRRNGNDF